MQFKSQLQLGEITIDLTLLEKEGGWRSGDFDEYNDLVSHVIKNYSCWEPFQTEIFCELLKEYKGDSLPIFVDVGAHLGYYSLIAEKLNYNVVAFEPNSVFYNICCKNLGFASSTNSVIAGILVKNVYVEIRKLINWLRVYNIPINDNNNLDDFLEGRVIDILKIDIEGGELTALSGASQLIKERKIRNIIMEISPKLIEYQKYVDVVMDLSQLYRVYDIGVSPPRKFQPNTNHLQYLKELTLSRPYLESYLAGMNQSNFLFRLRN